MSSLLRKIWRDLVGRRARTALTILGIAIGVAGLVAITSTARNLTRAQRALYASTSQADISVWVWNAPANLVPLLERDPRIAAAELRTTYVTRWRSDGTWRDIELVGIDDFGWVRVNQFDVLDGRTPRVGELLLDLSASQEAGVGPGDEILLRDTSGRARTLRVSGISRSPGYLSSTITNIALGYVPAETVRRILDIPGSNQLLIKLGAFADGQSVAQRVVRLLRRQGLQAGAPALRDPANFAGKRELDALIVIMFLFSGLGLVLSSTLVINTLSASVAEQIDEIGVIKALGGTRGQVLFIYLLETALLGLCGTVLGIALGALLGWRLLEWIASLGNATVGFQVAPEGLLLGTITGMLTSTLGGLAPALRGARLSIREALASYGIRSDYGQSWLDGQLQRLRRLPPLLAMAIRNLSRRALRSVLTLLVISFAAASFLGAVSTRDSVAQAISSIYETYASDAWVWLAEDVAAPFEGALLTVEGVEEAEGWALADGIVGFSEARLWGIPPGSNLYRQVMREGRWYREGETDVVVLSSELADARGLQVGDTVEIQAQSRSRRFEVVGVAIDHTIFLGGELAGKAFMPRDALGRLLGREDRLSFFALGLSSREPQVADEILARLETKFAQLRPTVQPVYEEIAAAEEGSRLLTIALSAMLIIVALVGSLGILNTMTLNVLERRREIAVIRAMGGSDLAILLAFLGEGLALGSLGWLVGLILGYPAGRFFTGQMGQVLFALEFVLRPQALLLSLAFTAGLALLASLGPAIIAAHVSPNVALRYE